MNLSQNSVPVRTYVRSRASTVVTDVGDLDNGSVTLDLAKPSDVTIILVSNAAAAQPALFVAAVGRVPDLDDFDVIISPTDATMVKAQDRVTLRLPAGQAVVHWKGYATDASAQPFPLTGSRLVLAVDQ